MPNVQDIPSYINYVQQSRVITLISVTLFLVPFSQSYLDSAGDDGILLFTSLMEHFEEYRQ